MDITTKRITKQFLKLQTRAYSLESICNNLSLLGSQGLLKQNICTSFVVKSSGLCRKVCATNGELSHNLFTAVEVT